MKKRFYLKFIVIYLGLNFYTWLHGKISQNALPPALETKSSNTFYKSKSPLISSKTTQLKLQSTFIHPIRNTLVNDPFTDPIEKGFTQSETTLVLGSNNTVIVSFNDSGSPVAGVNHYAGWARSIDQGDHFTDLGTVSQDSYGDPALARDQISGRIYFATLPFLSAPPRVQIFRSDNDGISFLPPANAMPGFSGGDVLDKEWITVDNFPGAGQGNVYVCVYNISGGGLGSQPGGIYFTRSQDGGNTWTPNGGILMVNNPRARYGWVTVGPDHTVYFFWLEQLGFNTPNMIKMRKSIDFGASFDNEVTIHTLNATRDAGDLELEFDSNCFPQSSVNPINGNIYVVFGDQGSGNDRADIFLTQSTDQGTNWSLPVKVNDDNTINDQWQPALAVAADGSRLLSFFYDRRNDTNNYLIDVYARIATLSGTNVNFSASFPVNTQSFPPVFGIDPIYRPGYMGDYDQAVADTNFFYITWADNRLGTPDVRFAKIPINADTNPPILLESVTLIAESFQPANGFIEPGEEITLSFRLKNIGNVNTPILTTTLLNTNGVTMAGPGQGLGILPPGGPAVTQSFSFTASTSLTPAVLLQATLQLQNGNLFYGSGFKNFLTGIFFINPNNNIVPPKDSASIYPWTLQISRFDQPITNVTVTLYGLTHTFPDDLDILLENPTGQTVMLMSDAGEAGRITNINLTFTDVSSSLPSESQMISGSYHPSNYDGSDADFFPSPAPSVSPATNLNVLNGLNPNGTWKLYIRDDSSEDRGSVMAWGITLNGFSPEASFSSGDFAGDGSPDILTFKKGPEGRLYLLNIKTNQLANVVSIPVPSKKAKFLVANRVQNQDSFFFKQKKNLLLNSYTIPNLQNPVEQKMLTNILNAFFGKVSASGDLDTNGIIDVITVKGKKIRAFLGPNYTNSVEITGLLTNNQLPGKIVGLFKQDTSNPVLVFQKGVKTPIGFSVAPNGVSTPVHVTFPNPRSKIQGLAGNIPIIQKGKKIQAGDFFFTNKFNSIQNLDGGKVVGPK